MPRLIKIAIIPLLLAILVIGCREPGSDRIRVVTTTSMLGTIARSVGGESVEVVVIVPGGMCPGHFDIKPDDIEALSDADLVLNHGWEEWFEDLMESAGSNPPVRTVDIPGSWMVPEIHKSGVEEVLSRLISVDPTNDKYYRANAEKYISGIDSAISDIEAANLNLAGVKAVASEHQAELLRRFGIEVVAEFGRGEDLTAKSCANIVETCRKEKVRLIVDNLQSGGSAGDAIARETGAAHVVLTNFPIDGSYISALQENLGKVSEAVGL